jgi:ABC-2 type transport system permease protein
MRRFLTLLGREVSRALLQPLAWVVLACFLALTGVNFQAGVVAMNSQPSVVSAVEAFFNSLLFWFPFLLCFPLLTMRLYSEEYKLGTIETLMTAPVRDIEIVLAKYLGALVFFALLWLPSLVYFGAFLWVTGQPPAGSAGSFLGAYLMLFLAGGFYLSLGCLASSLTDNQIVAGVVAAAFVCLSFFLGLLWFFFPMASPDLRVLAWYFSTIEHMAGFSQGIFDTRPVVLYASLTAFVLFLNHHVLQRRRWRG